MIMLGNTISINTSKVGPSGSPPVSPSTTDLLAYWTLNETGGTRLDSHTGGYDLTDNNTVGYQSAGVISVRAARFASYNESLTREGITGDLQLGGIDFTISFWALATSWANYANWLINKRGGGGGREFQISRVASTGLFAFTIWNAGATSYSVESTIAPELSTWYHVVARWNHTTKLQELIINNGTPNSQVNAGVTITGYTYDMTIGHAAWAQTDPNYNHRGYIDECCIYTRVLSDAEVAWLYNSGSGRTYSDL